jgi:hypothetical protein
MTGLFLGMVAGFAGGVLYSRNKANPVHAVWFDLKRGARAARRWTGEAVEVTVRYARKVHCPRGQE